MAQSKMDLFNTLQIFKNKTIQLVSTANWIMETLVVDDQVLYVCIDVVMILDFYGFS